MTVNMIILQNDLLKFDITGILGFEINQHVEFYRSGVDEAYMAINNKDNGKALSILKAIKLQLDKEYKYFNTKRFRDFGVLNNAHSYVDGINRASRALIGSPNYKNMKSMLYDIQDYMTSFKYKDEVYYGNIFALAVDNRLAEMTNEEYHLHIGKLLQSIRFFYIRPGIGSAKECIKLSEGVSKKSLEPYIFKEYFAKYIK